MQDVSLKSHRKKSDFYLSQKLGGRSGCEDEPDHEAATLPGRLLAQPDTMQSFRQMTWLAPGSRRRGRIFSDVSRTET